MIYKKICPKCNKEIKSLNENQLNYNYTQHIESHKRKLPKSKNIQGDIKKELNGEQSPDAFLNNVKNN